MDHNLSPCEECPVHETNSLNTSNIIENESPAIEFRPVRIKCENNSLSQCDQSLENRDFMEEHNFSESDQNKFSGIRHFLCETVTNSNDFSEGTTGSSKCVLENNCFVEKEEHIPGPNAVMVDTQLSESVTVRKVIVGESVKCTSPKEAYIPFCKECGKLFVYNEGYNVCCCTSQKETFGELLKKALSSGSKISKFGKRHDRLLTCTVCDMTFPRIRLLTNHYSRNHGMKLFKCNICERFFSSEASVSSHKVKHMTAKFKCDICEKMFHLHSRLKVHLIQHNPEPHSDVKQRQCHICGKLFGDRNTHNSHMKYHRDQNKRSRCKYCRKEYAHSSLSKHFRSAHGTKPLMCDICCKRFSDKSHLKKHIHWHMGYKPYKCPVCNRKFIQKSNLSIHMVTHTGVKNFQCPLCFSCFSLKQSLKLHMRTHEHT